MIRHAAALFACLLAACVADPTLGAVEQGITVEDIADLPPCSLLAPPVGEVSVTAVDNSGGLAAVAVDGLLVCFDDLDNLAAAGYVDLPGLDVEVGVDNPAGAVADGTPLPANDHADGTPLPAHGPGTPIDEVTTLTTIDTAATRATLAR
jgi:hypothetical protein